MSDIILEKEEVENIKWVSIKELRQMIDNGRLYRYSDDYFELLSKYIKI